MRRVLYSSVAMAGLAIAASGQLTGWAETSDQMQTVADARLAPHAAVGPTTQWGSLDTFWGSLDTFWGSLDTFEGENTQSWGSLDTFWGSLDTFWGSLDTFHTDLDAYWGSLDTFWGSLDTFEGEPMWGSLDTFWGSLDTFEGSQQPFWGSLDTFWGSLDTFSGDVNARWGSLDTFWGSLDTFHTERVNFEGDYSAFYGSLDPSWGSLDTFWGSLDTFNGNLDSSWGSLDTFWGSLDTFEGGITQQWGSLDTFWGSLDTFWGSLDTFWGSLDTFSEANADEYNELLTQLGTFYNMSQDQFAIPVALMTRQDFYSGFAKDIFDKYGIDPSDASTLSGMTATERAMFFVEWYDTLMLFTGMDRVDSWMHEVNWSPALTQDHDFQTQSVIGLLDFGVTDETLFTHDVIYNGGYETGADDAHGSAVVSLMIAPHDTFGIMGIAPNASVAIYNPFDETNSAGWEDVETGVNALVANDARIINMSLGVPGVVLSEEWSDILGGVVDNPYSEGTIFVKAAGNEGAVQTDDVAWGSQEALDRLIIVGSTGIDGEIAGWSNTPGEACAVIGGVCDEDNKLKYNFMVAPGEFILVSDGKGGVMRQVGTSFSAPLVSGTAALIHGAWPWWKGHGEETVDVILQSATDLGEEGVDSVYGWGMLNVEAALSPLSWDNLQFYYAKSANGRLKKGKSASWMRRAYLKSDVVKLENKGAYVVAIETVGDTYRDFRIPLSTQLFGEVSVVDQIDQQRKFQRHMYQRFVDWATSGSSFGDVQSFQSDLGLNGDWSLAMNAAPYAPGTDVREGDLPFQTDLSLRQRTTGAEIRFGHGDGAARLNSSSVFGFYSDFDVQTGGVNPIFGLASGGAYASSAIPLSDRLTLEASVTEASDDHSYIDPLTDVRLYGANGLSEYEAQAANIAVDYQLTDNVSVSLDYTQLRERDSLLGDQGTGLFSLEGGAVTDAVTVGSDIALPFDFAIGASATLGQTDATEFDGGFLSIADGGLTSSAFAVGIRKNGIFGDNDIMRMSLAQPLRLETGEFVFTSIEVVDRETGELGQVSQNWGLADTGRRLNLELSYGAALFDGMGEISAFTRADVTETEARNPLDPDYAVGARFAIRY